jgi:hypothetical protein
VSRILAEEEKADLEIANKYGPVHYTIPSICLGGIMCKVAVRCKFVMQVAPDEELLVNTVGEQIYTNDDGQLVHMSKIISEGEGTELVLYVHATDEQFGEYYLETTFEHARAALSHREELPPTQVGGYELGVVLPLMVKHLVWLESKNTVERRIKHLTLSRPKPPRSRTSHTRKTRSLSPVREQGHSVRTPIKKKVTPPRRVSISRAEQVGRRASIASELIAKEEAKHEQHTADYGRVQYRQLNVKLSGIACHVDVRFELCTESIDQAVCFHVVDDKLKDYFLKTSFSECTHGLRKRGIIGEDETYDDATGPTPLAVKHLLWLEYVDPNERRVKKLTLGRPFREPSMRKPRKTRSMSPIRKRGDAMISEHANVAESGDSSGLGQSLVETRKRLRAEASAVALAKDDEIRRELAKRYGPVVFEKEMKLANIPFQVAVRYDKEAGDGELLFHAVDDFLTDYTFPCTMKGCMTTLAVRGFPASDELEADQLIPMFVEKLLWFENVDETERRKKRLTLNRPVRLGSRVPMKKKSNFREST